MVQEVKRMWQQIENWVGENTGVFRYLNSGDKSYAQEIFADSINMSDVIIYRIPSALINGRGLTLGNRIYLPDTYFIADSFSLNAEGRNILIHELVHTWQFQNADPGLGQAYAFSSLIEQRYGQIEQSDNSYNWQQSFNAGVAWEDWGVEHQAQAIEDYNVAIRRILSAKRNGKSAPSADLGIIAELNSVDAFNKLRSKVGAPTYNKYFRFVKEVWDLWRAGS